MSPSLVLQAFLLGNNQGFERKENMSKRMNGIGIILSAVAFLAVIWLTQKPVYADPAVVEVSSFDDLRSEINSSDANNPKKIKITSSISCTGLEIGSGKGIEIVDGVLNEGTKILIETGGVLILSGSGTINYNGQDMAVNCRGSFTMTGGVINIDAGTRGVYVNGGTFLMSGGQINNNAAEAGVNVLNGTFSMNGGTIENKSNRSNSYAVTCSGGTTTISGNANITNSSQNGKCVRCVNGNFIRTGGTITGGAVVNGSVEQVAVSFLKNNTNATGSMAYQYIPKDSATALSANQFNLENHNFLGWSESSSATTATYSDGQSVTFAVDKTLYAVWGTSGTSSTDHTITVTNDGNGSGRATPSSASSDAVINLSATPNGGYEFDHWEPLSDVNIVTPTSANTTFRMIDQNVTVKAHFKRSTPSPKKKSKDDSSKHDDDPAPSKPNNTKVPDGCDELRAQFSNAIAAAKSTGKPQTIYWSKSPSIPADVMRMLQGSNITLVFSCKYQGFPITLTIPGSAVIISPAVEWYGPVFLYALYGNNKLSTATTTTKASTQIYTVQSGDTLSGIAGSLGTNVPHLKQVNSKRKIFRR